jgi:hypothetical protein
MTKPQTIARAKALDGRIILQVSATLLLLAALILWGAGWAGAAGVDEPEPGVLAQNAEVKDASVAVTIGADLTATDGSGNAAPWAFSYDAVGEPTHLTVKVEAPSVSGAVTYSTKLDADSVNDLIQWLTAVKAKMDQAQVR